MRTESFFDYEHSKNFIFAYHKCARNYFMEKFNILSFEDILTLLILKCFVLLFFFVLIPTFSNNFIYVKSMNFIPIIQDRWLNSRKLAYLMVYILLSK